MDETEAKLDAISEIVDSIEDPEVTARVAIAIFAGVLGGIGWDTGELQVGEGTITFSGLSKLYEAEDEVLH